MVSGTNDRYLQKGVALPLVYEVMEPNLIWGGMTRHVKEDDDAFMYQYAPNKSADAKKKTPPKLTIGARFPELDRTRKITSAGLLESNGFSMRVPHKVIRSKAGKSEIMEDYEFAGFWMAEWINTNILTALRAGATAGTAAGANWSASTANPVDDLITWDADMVREGYPFRMTDGFTNKAQWYELVKYLTAIDISDEKQKTLYGVPEISKDRVHIPVVSTDVHKVLSGTTDGEMLMLDRNNPAAETHYYIDPEFSQAKVTYRTVVDRKPQDVTVPNLGIHYDTYVEQDSKDTIMQFWVENKTIVTQSYGILIATGL